MAISSLPLSYCTNVHPGRSLVEVEQGLDDYTVPVASRFQEPLAAGLWLAADVVRELLAEPSRLPAFRDGLARRGLTCHTLNAFPFGDFHSRRVKENVYLPDWSDPRRLEYTVACARVLAALMPAGVEGSISTMPLYFKGFDLPPEHLDRCVAQLLETASALHRLEQETGRLIRLAIEPEPFCRIETTPETIEFFRILWQAAESRKVLDVARQYLGMCYDVCHQAVEFEDVARSIEELTTAGVRIAKVHITCALQLDSPAENIEGRRALARFVEERYLHQTLARAVNGRVVRQVDLTQALALEPPADFRNAETWRIHFHVPVDAEHLGPLATTRPELRRALAAVARLDYAPHLEVETYTWDVMPGEPDERRPRLIEGLSRELTATCDLLAPLKRAVPEDPALPGSR
jgi:sugar phosphate isomerase/epimerase